MSVNINYIVASFGGLIETRQPHENFGEDILHNNIISLFKCISSTPSTQITQVTVVVPDIPETTKKFKNYYRFDEWRKMFATLPVHIPIIELRMNIMNKYHSYSQYMYAVDTFPYFTHVIIIEDDYYVRNFERHRCFDYHLVDIYRNRLPEGIGYVGGKVHLPDYQGRCTMTTSNGIISMASFERIKRVGPNPKGTLLKELMRVADSAESKKWDFSPQSSFSFIFRRADMHLKDFWNSPGDDGLSCQSPFWCRYRQVIIDYNRHCDIPVIFCPVQFRDYELLEPVSYPRLPDF